jgi:hypothetical protein
VGEHHLAQHLGRGEQEDHRIQRLLGDFAEDVHARRILIEDQRLRIEGLDDQLCGRFVDRRRQETQRHGADDDADQGEHEHVLLDEEHPDDVARRLVVSLSSLGYGGIHHRIS